MITAKFNGSITTASEFQHREISDKNLCADDTEYQLICPTTGYRLTHVSESSDGRIPHFRYCPETPKHKRAGQTVEHETLVRGSVAASEVSRLLTSVEVCNTEIESGGYEAKVSNKESREPDVLLEFEKRDSQLGEGLIIEVQVSNKNKNKALTTADYLSFDRDYSVLWLSDSDFNTSPDAPRDWQIVFSDETQLREVIRQQIWPTTSSISVWGENTNEMSECIRALYNKSIVDANHFLKSINRQYVHIPVSVPNKIPQCEILMGADTETPSSEYERKGKLRGKVRYNPGISTTELGLKYDDWGYGAVAHTLSKLDQEGKIANKAESGEPSWYYTVDK
jgi:hypothetical protein